MDLQVVQHGNAYFVTGDTFDAKNILKRHGARWDGFRQGWKFQDEVTARLAAVEASSHLAMLAELAELEAM